MCRICGRMVKCFFENMPSRVRIHHVPSRRAFTTLRRLPTSSNTMSLVRRPQSSLTQAFSTLSLTSTSTRPTLSSLPPPSMLRSALGLQPPSRPFSSTSAALGYRRQMDTYSPSRRVQKRRHGYLARMKCKGGQAVIKRRRLKKRSDVSW